MFAIDHAATALVLKRAYPRAPLLWLLLSVQLMELLWVLLNNLGIERTTTEATIRTVGDIHLAHMPYSHSVVMMLGAAVVAWIVIARGLGRPEIGVAVALGIASHLVLDLLTHDRDIALAPFVGGPELGLGLYAALPLVAFAVELAYGVLCWWLSRGGAALLGVIALFNLANLSMFSAAVPGPEVWLAGRPMVITTVILLQIVVTLVLVGVLAGRGASAERPAEAEAASVEA